MVTPSVTDSMWPSSRYSQRNSWYCWLISGQDCNLPSIRVCRAVAICNESPITIGGPALNDSLTIYLTPPRECVETKWFSHYSSSSLKGSFCGTSLSSQNLRSKMLVSHLAVQSDTWALSGSDWATLTGLERIQPKTVFWAAGASVGPRRRGSCTMRIGSTRSACGSGAGLTDPDSPAQYRGDGATYRETEFAGLCTVMLGSTYAVSEIIRTDLSRGDSPSETLVLTPSLSIPATPLIVTSMRCRLVRNVWQRDSEIKLRVEAWSTSARTETRRPSVVWRLTHAVGRIPRSSRGTFCYTAWT